MTAGIVLLTVLGLVLQQLVSGRRHAPPRDRATPSQVTAEAGSVIRSTARHADDAAQPAADAECADIYDWCGRVVDAVSLEPLREFDVSLREYREYVTAPGEVIERHFRSRNGRFAFVRLTPRDWQVEIRARGYQVFRIETLPFPVSDPGLETVIPMRRGLVLKGRVYDEATGAGVGGASINVRESQQALYDSGWRDRPTVASRPDGSFTLSSLPQGRVALTISAPDYAAVDYWTDTGSKGVVEIPLSGGGSIAGRVARADGTAPSAGFISLFGLDGHWGTITRTEADGRFEYSRLAPGRYRLTGESAQGRSRALQVSLRKGQRIEGLELRLEGVHVIRGIVTGLSTREREVAIVRLLRGERWEIGVDGPLEVPLGADGSYVLKNVAPGPARVMAEVEDGRHLEKAIDMPADRDLTVDLPFPAGSRLSGQVRRGDQVAPRRWVQLLTHISQREFGAATTTSESGSYEFVGVPNGLYRIRVGTIDTRTVRISGDTRLDFDLPTGKLAGKVVEADAATPVVGAEIQVWSGTTNPPMSAFTSTTDDFGAFSMEGLAPGEFVVSVYKPGFQFSQQPLTFSDSVTDQVLTLRRDEGVELRAHDRQSGDALRLLYVSDADAVSKAGVAKPDALARFILRLDANGVGRLPSGLLEQPLALWAEDYAPVKITSWDGGPLDLRFTRTSQEQ